MAENNSNRRFYRAKAKEWQLGESENGKPFVGVLFEVLTADAQEKHLTWRGFFTEATTERTIESLRYMGFEGDDLEQLVGLDRNEVDLVVEDEEYDGKTYARVQWVNRAAALRVKQALTGDKAKSFAASMKAAFRTHDAANGKRASSAKSPTADKRPEPPPLSDADIPF